MKNRKIPYGYAYENGNIVTSPKESEIVAEIFRDYLAGRSLSEIAQRLNVRQVEYMPGVSGWNKSRLKRILEDGRYIGQKGFYAVIKEQDFERAQKIKNEKGPLINQTGKEKKYWSRVPVLCSQCGGEMQRKYNNRLKNKVKWICRNGHSVRIDDDMLFGRIDERLKEIADDTERIKVGETKKDSANDKKSERLSKNIGDKEQAKEELLRHASREYGSLDDKVCKTRRLRDIFAEADTSNAFPEELFEKSTDAVVLAEDGSVGLVLINGQEIR